ncbi:hypothetical protein [Zunongwangia sp.]|uniref:hypothetical protein n=1 Tax=Zunongwangia sp. TaxID=1965325 RepID=UPI003AA98C60
MRYIFLISFVLTNFVTWSQHTLTAIIADANNHQPLEFVDVFNTKKYTATNGDGRFEFTTLKDSVSFHRLGYQKISYKISDFQLDTLFLTASVENLATVRLADKTLY